MSTTKQRNRRNRQRKFIDNEDENEIPVEDESQIKHRLQEKADVMFDPHKLKGNIINEQVNDKSKELGEFNVFQMQKPEHVDQEMERFDDEEREEETKKTKKPKKRMKREKKNVEVDEEEEDTRMDLPSTLKKETNEQKQQRQQIQQKEENRSDKEEGNSSDKEEEEQIAKMLNAKKAREATQKMGNYLVYHAHLALAGTNKQDRKETIFTPLQENQHSFVYFKRYQSGLSEYYQILGEDQRPIMFSENQRGCIGCNYYISMTKEMDKNSPSYLGKLRGNAAGSEYQLFDCGAQPNNNTNRSKWRVTMAYIEYQSNFLGMKGPRKFVASVPNPGKSADFDMFKLSEEQSLMSFKPPIVVRFRNKQPRWNEKLKSYALNFGGRVKEASIKNFILIDDRYQEGKEDEADNIITFGKMDENTFSLEFRHPLSLYQAFGIALSQFDFKIKCQ